MSVTTRPKKQDIWFYLILLGLAIGIILLMLSKIPNEPIKKVCDMSIPKTFSINTQQFRLIEYSNTNNFIASCINSNVCTYVIINANAFQIDRDTTAGCGNTPDAIANYAYQKEKYRYDLGQEICSFVSTDVYYCMKKIGYTNDEVFLAYGTFKSMPTKPHAFVIFKDKNDGIWKILDGTVMSSSLFPRDYSFSKYNLNYIVNEGYSPLRIKEYTNISGLPSGIYACEIAQLHVNQ